MITIEWDEAGYPDDASIEKIPDLVFHDFEVEVEPAWNFLKRVLQECANNNCSSFSLDVFKDPWRTSEDEEITFTTGGWSGAESLIYAIEKNVWLSQYLYTWRRGGLYVFRSR